jgi:uracil-DNA glycosylase
MLTLNIMQKPIDQTWSIERIANEVPPRTWEAVFEDAKPELHDVSMILEEQERIYGQFYPLKKDIFAAFNYTSLDKVKAVILGQDPYHQIININGVALPRAVGLSFSVRREDSIPSSLQNIFTELSHSVRGFTKPDHGDLREWAYQGVLLLNTCLTVRPGQPGSHGEIWLGFIKKVFKAIAAVNPYCVYMLWGREAQKVIPMLGEHSVILEAAHPSGHSAKYGFFGCNHFNLTNEALIRQGKVGINWKISPLAELTSPAVKVTSSLQLLNNGHQPKLAPVNVSMLPTIIGVHTVTIPQQYKSTPPPSVSLLPIIPNIKPISPINNPSSPQEPTTPPQKPTTPPTNYINTQAKVLAIPIIPKIHFGDAINTPPPIAIGTVPLFLTRSHILSSQSVSKPPILTGLPIIPSVVE